jgi:hypothetical protein
LNDNRHAELVSAPIAPQGRFYPAKAQWEQIRISRAATRAAKWTLKQVQGDDLGRSRSGSITLAER